MAAPYHTAIKTDIPHSSSSTCFLRNTSHLPNFVSTHSTTPINKECFIEEHLVSLCTANFISYNLAWSVRSLLSQIHPWLQHLLDVNRLQNNSGRNGTAVWHSGHAGSKSNVPSGSSYFQYYSTHVAQSTAFNLPSATPCEIRRH